jgi:hypothetical protein
MKMAKKNKIKLETPSTVAEAVANLYTVFRRYEAPAGLLDVCTGCCMDEKLEKEMRRLPLASLYRKHFYEYNDSAKSEVQPAPEIKYFIPRMFELLSEGEDLHHSTELYLDRVGRVPEGAFSEDERKALDDFAFVFFSEGLKQSLNEEKGLFQRNDAFTILLMFEIGGFNIAPLLDHWVQQNASEATLNFAYSTLWHFWHDGEEIGMAFAGNRPDFRATMKAWITNAENRDAFAKKIVDLVSDSSPEFLQEKIGCRDTYEDALNEVFQRIAY